MLSGRDGISIEWLTEVLGDKDQIQNIDHPIAVECQHTNQLETV